MSWYNPASWSGDDWKRVGTAAVTGGASELANPLVAKATGGNGGIVGDVLNKAGVPNPGNLLKGPSPADTSALNTAQNRAFSTADYLGNQLQNFQGQKAPQAGMVQLDQGQINPLRNQQQGAIDMLTAAANGTAPSAAELQGKAAADRLASQQFGQAAALQGGQSAGGALRQALVGSQNVVGDANQAAMINRANEQATARNQLVQGLQGFRGQEQDLAGTNAGLTQQTNLANQAAGLQQQNLNQDWMKALLSGQLQSQGQGVQGAGQIADVNARNNAAQNQWNAGLINAGVSAAPYILSDKREKRDVKPADLDTLADALKGFRFRYRDQKDGAGERVGVMAQDVAKGGPVGRRMVNLGGDGRLRLDTANAVGAALAMSAEALKRAN